jgi:hypothetical protein
MAAIKEHDLVLHKVKAKLYPNHFQNVDGNYIARTNNEKTLDQNDIATTIKTRGGYQGSTDDLLQCIEAYNAEVAYQLCDGYAVTNGWYTIYPNIGGTFESPRDTPDPVKNKVSMKFSLRKRLLDATKNISVEIEGVADTNGFIDYLIDQEENEAAHNLYVPGNMISIHGNKIKVAGDHADNGVYFVPVDDPSKAVKMERVGDNNPTRITGIAPQTGYMHNRLEIRTQFTGAGDKFLKTPRTITSAFTVDEA